MILQELLNHFLSSHPATICFFNFLREKGIWCITFVNTLIGPIENQRQEASCGATGFYVLITDSHTKQILLILISRKIRDTELKQPKFVTREKEEVNKTKRHKVEKVKEKSRLFHRDLQSREKCSISSKLESG